MRKPPTISLPGTALLLPLLFTSPGTAAQVAARDEPRHRTVLENGSIRILDLWIRAGDSCPYHKHDIPYLFTYLSSTQLRTQVQGELPVEQKVEPGQTGYHSPGTKPFIHKIQVRDAVSLHAIEIEWLGETPKGRSERLHASGMSLEADSARYRAYRIELPPGTRLQLQLQGNPVVILPFRGDGQLDMDGQSNDLYQGQYQWVDEGKGLVLKNIGEGKLEGYLFEIKR